MVADTADPVPGRAGGASSRRGDDLEVVRSARAPPRWPLSAPGCPGTLATNRGATRRPPRPLQSPKTSQNHENQGFGTADRPTFQIKISPKADPSVGFVAPTEYPAEEDIGIIGVIVFASCTII